jgi:hypothetical protein
VDLFLEAHRSPPRQILLDLDATDVPLHGHQEGRFFHGYYDAYCYLPLYVFCGRHLLASRLRRANIDASAGAVEEIACIVGRIRARWPRVRILLRADSGFARKAFMAWCERNRVDFVFGLARNPRLVEELAIDLAWAEEEASRTGQPARRFRDFRPSTLDSWSRRPRVIGKAEWTRGEACDDRCGGRLDGPAGLGGTRAGQRRAASIRMIKGHCGRSTISRHSGGKRNSSGRSTCPTLKPRRSPGVNSGRG